MRGASIPYANWAENRCHHAKGVSAFSPRIHNLFHINRENKRDFRWPKPMGAVVTNAANMRFTRLKWTCDGHPPSSRPTFGYVIYLRPQRHDRYGKLNNLIRLTLVFFEVSFFFVSFVNVSCFGYFVFHGLMDAS